METALKISVPAVNELAKKIQDEITEGKQRAEIAVENEKTITYWKIGRHIHTHLLEHNSRAEYGQELFKSLAEKLVINQRILYQSVKFYEEYPNILNARSKLGWTHYRILLTVKSDEKRKELEEKIINENLSTRELKDIIEKDTVNKNGKQNKSNPVKRGIPFIYKLKYKDNKKSILCLDCGFNFYMLNVSQDILKYNVNDIITVTKKNNEYKMTILENSKEKIYTYKAEVKEILNGDTIWMDVDLGFGNFTRQKLRLRNINAPDIKLPEGKRVKKFISSKLNSCQFVIVRTHCRDKFTRYLADIFYDKNITDEYELAEKEKLLNKELLDKGLVVRY